MIPIIVGILEKPEKVNGRTWHQETVNINYNTEQSPGEPKRLATSRTSVNATSYYWRENLKSII